MCELCRFSDFLQAVAKDFRGTRVSGMTEAWQPVNAPPPPNSPVEPLVTPLEAMYACAFGSGAQLACKAPSEASLGTPPPGAAAAPGDP